MPGTMEQIGNISGSLSPVESIAGTLSPTSTLQGVLTIPDSVPISIYDGAYEVTPQPYSEIVLETNGLKMGDDVTVHEIPYYTTTNLSGGYTAIIGG